MIHKRNPLSVKANGIMNISKMTADVDSNSNSTMPMEYSTGTNIQSGSNKIEVDKSRTSEKKMGCRKCLTLEHSASQRFSDYAQS
jgi:hypothetical protein